MIGLSVTMIPQMSRFLMPLGGKNYCACEKEFNLCFL